jgi:glycine cleavage system H lipoate-binding protein
MTVLLVLGTFLVFIALDYYLSQSGVRAAVKTTAIPAPSPVLQPAYVDGFLTPQELRYHPGHSWVHEERSHLFRVGADEFAAALLGKIVNFHRGEDSARLVSPIEGEVVEVNSEVLKDPSLLRKDPYGAGWLITIRVPDVEGTVRNLVPEDFVGDWMRGSVRNLFALQPQMAGAVAADGGVPVEDISKALPAITWKELTGKFFLTSNA